MNYKIVFFDVDGTLLNRQNKIPPSTKNAIKKLQDNGIITAIATGRPTYETQSIMDELNITNTVTMNGGQVLIEGKIIINKTINDNLVQKIIEKANEYDESLTLFGINGAHHTNINHEIYQMFAEYLPVRKNNMPIKKIGDIQLITVYCKKEETESQLAFAQEELEIIKWIDMFKGGYHVDLHPIGQNKAEGIKILLKELKIEPHESIAFGDGVNDIEMIQFAGLGVAMGNAHDELKKKAALVTSHIDDDGIEKALNKIGLL